MHRNTPRRRSPLATVARRSTLALALAAAAAPALAGVTLYEDDNFRGRSFTTEEDINRLSDRNGFNDRASSIVVQRERWQICEGADFSGQCVVLRPGRYASLRSMGLNDAVSSARVVQVYGPDGQAARDDGQYAWRRRGGEKLFDARVTSVRAVVGPPEQRCWTEREEASERRANVPGAVAGALLGGILGHQVGGGSGRDIATVGGAVAGGAIGSQVNGGGRGARDVQRCEPVAGSSGRTEYWDVTYDFRGREHHVQMTQPRGRTIKVNRDGEPRG